MYKVISSNILLRKKKRKFTKKSHTLYLVLFFFYNSYLFTVQCEINKRNAIERDAKR